MSLYDYKESQEIAHNGFSFYALIMAAMRSADTDNLVKMQTAWPDVWRELQARYNAPGGIIDGDVLPEDDDSEPSDIGIVDDLDDVKSTGSVIDLMEALKRSLRDA